MTGQPNSTRFYQEEIENVTLQLTQAVDEKTRQNLEIRLRAAKQYLVEPNPAFKQ
jgi:DNA polymerase elongation subunit (family B)